MSDPTLDVYKKDKNVLKFMKKYRYQSSRAMFSDLATLARGFYLEGYNNGLGQHPVIDPNEEIEKEIKPVHLADIVKPNMTPEAHAVVEKAMKDAFDDQIKATSKAEGLKHD